jgi:hypothetical protein
MKKLINLFCTGVLMSALCVGFAACDDAAETQGEDVPFTVYPVGDETLPGQDFSAHWVNLDYVESVSKTLVIDSDEELKKYVEGDYPPVDFSTKTLVLAYGSHSGVGFGSDVTFRQVSDGNYLMTTRGMATAMMAFFEWQIAIVVDKLPTDSKINLKTIVK